MHYEPQDGKWQLGENASLLAELRQRMTPEAYEQEKQALKEFLCGYFSTGECRNAQGSSISPMKASPGGGKVLKVRWAYPGCGKSGSLRLVVVAYCEQKRVHIAQAFDRRANPTDDEIADAVSDL
ncbi:MAG: hypothetical protein R3C19_19890 [Planctomycetaceae bacterium]